MAYCGLCDLKQVTPSLNLTNEQDQNPSLLLHRAVVKINALLNTQAERAGSQEEK